MTRKGLPFRQPLFGMEGRLSDMSRATEFLARHGMSPERIDPIPEAERMADSLREGLAHYGATVPMIPTWLRVDGAIEAGEKAVVIDAGGTNFRCALARFTADGCRIEQMSKRKMPGIETPATWDEFIAFTADAIEPLLAEADAVGFCFSYSADITPEIDGRVIRIDKEVTITGCEGKLVGESLLAELERRGVTGKRVVVLNDTAAVLLGGTASLDKTRYDGFIGQVSGTGTNTCCVLPLSRIGKLGRAEETRILVNLESGLYDGLPRGGFDLALDRASQNPGLKFLEKLTAGVYLGELVRLMVEAAAGEGEIAPETTERVRELGRFDAAAVDAWAAGEGLGELCAGAEDARFLRELSRAMFERSARAMCVNLLAILLLTGEGREKPVCLCAEGSLVQKGRYYRPRLEALLREFALGALGRSVELRVGQETTLPGAAAAALLNA